jgi:small subunit ribosomal protein S8
MSTVTDPIADFLTRIRNGNAARKAIIDCPYSRIKADIAKILKEEGYITDYSVDTTGQFPVIKLTSKFVNRKSAIEGIKRISRPGLRKYVGATEIPRVLGGLGVSILSTPKGVLAGHRARKENVGGEVLAYIW